MLQPRGIRWTLRVAKCGLLCGLFYSSIISSLKFAESTLFNRNISIPNMPGNFPFLIIPVGTFFVYLFNSSEGGFSYSPSIAALPRDTTNRIHPFLFPWSSHRILQKLRPTLNRCRTHFISSAFTPACIQTIIRINSSPRTKSTSSSLHSIPEFSHGFIHIQKFDILHNFG